MDVFQAMQEKIDLLEKRNIKEQQEKHVLERRLDSVERQAMAERQEKENQMKVVLEKLVAVETDLTKERKRMHNLMESKEKIIKKQQDKITQLQETNQRLLAGVERLKSHYSNRNGMGSKASIPGTNDIIDLPEFEERKQSESKRSVL